MKKAVGMIMVSILMVMCVNAQTPSKIKIDSATDGKYPNRFMNGRMRECDDTSMILRDSKISGPEFEVIDDSVVLNYTFYFDAPSLKCIASRIAVFELYDNKMNLLNKRRVEICQFDTLTRFFIFFTDKDFDSKGCFIQMKISTNDPSKEYVTPLYILPSRFKK